MPVEVGPSPQNDFGSLQGCFVEGSAEQRARERRRRRRALAISVAAQVAILSAIVLVPLFAKPARIAVDRFVPIPPYYHNNEPSRPPADPQPTRPHRRISPTDPFVAPTTIPTRIDPNPGEPAQEPSDLPPSVGPTAPCVGCIPIDDGRTQPARPPDPTPQRPKRLVVTRLEPAMLIQRVEPAYPTLMRQIRRGGRVELRAIIATDGTIQSLQVVSGDAGFVQSAMDAVRQWRYRPTVLNGQPVEIDTFITVTYNLQQ